MGISDLLLLGGEQCPNSERGVSCDGTLPAASDPQLVARAIAARSSLGDRAMVLGHNYQRDEVINFADIRGDSFKLAQAAADNNRAEFIFFCGVHFMAESADILTSPNQTVILPDLAAGCSMADMATASQVQDCWQVLEKLGVDFLFEKQLAWTDLSSASRKYYRLTVIDDNIKKEIEDDSLANRIGKKLVDKVRKNVKDELDAKYDKANLPEIVKDNCSHLEPSQ